ncbi:MAG TPA: ABC transporter permease [Kiloniellaceae bacterium]|nr:ABC transporter permease [Kiloniellaceae bacterium]HIP79878.1 ABC transporter permease [Kiloniellaceae bacterium]
MTGPARLSRGGIALTLGPALVVVGLFLVVPLLLVPVASFMEANPWGGVRPAFSVEAYVQVLFEEDFTGELIFNDAYPRIVLRSLALAALTTALCLLAGFPVAYVIALQPKSRQGILLLLVTVPFWTNLLIRTYSWIMILRDEGLINNGLEAAGLIEAPLRLLYTNGAIAVGLVYTFLPFMVLPIYAAIERIDRGLIEAAHDLYANRRAMLRHVVLPLARPGIAAGAILVFVPALGSFIAPALLGGGKHLMIGNLIQAQFGASRNWPFGSAMSLILLAAVLAVLLWQAQRRRAGGWQP